MVNNDSSSEKEKNTIQCSYCKEPVREDAQICKHCHFTIKFNSFKKFILNRSSVLATLISVVTVSLVAWNSWYNVKKIRYEFQQIEGNIIPRLEVEAISLYTDPLGRGEDSTQIWSGVILEIANFSEIGVKGVVIEKCDINLPDRPLIKKEHMWLNTPVLNIPEANPPNISWIQIKAPFTEAKSVIEEYKSGKKSFTVNVIIAYYYILHNERNVYRYRYYGEYRGGNFIAIQRGKIDN